MAAIYREYVEQEIGYRLVCKGELLKLIAHLVREYTVEFLTGRESDRRKKQLERLNLLKKKEGNVAEVADSVGFSDYNHFGRQFRRYYGCTPSEILKR